MTKEEFKARLAEATEELLRERENRLNRERRARNRDHVIKLSRELRAKNRDKINEQKRQRYAKNKDAIKEKERQWRLDNPEKVQQYTAVYRQRIAQDLERLNKHKEKSRNWRIANRDKLLAYKHKRYWENPEVRRKQLESVRRWVEAHPDYLAYRRKYERKIRLEEKAAMQFLRSLLGYKPAKGDIGRSAAREFARQAGLLPVRRKNNAR